MNRKSILINIQLSFLPPSMGSDTSPILDMKVRAAYLDVHSISDLNLDLQPELPDSQSCCLAMPSSADTSLGSLSWLSAVLSHINGVSYVFSVKCHRDNFKLNYIEEIKPNTVHMAWQIPQYLLITSGEVVFSVTGLAFSYSQSKVLTLTECCRLAHSKVQDYVLRDALKLGVVVAIGAVGNGHLSKAPSNMKSVLQAGWLLTNAIGNIVVLIVAEASTIQEQ
eukprot:g45874.t1